MRNTIENKAKFFAQYLNQRKAIYREGFILRDNINPNGIDEHDSLELKPLSQISDEDAIEVIGRVECSMRRNNPDSGYYGMSPSGIFVDSLIEHDSYHIRGRQLDFLRSKGYALPWMGISVEEQIDFGWVKLKEI